uniref:Uncharacterized protein n=1 Tax=Glossina pallidipes TaxID=7398 RepID=A0A1A9Z1T3_GLOPL
MLIVSSTSCSRSHYRHVTLSLVDRPSSDMLDLHRNSCGYLTQSAFDVVAAAVPVANRGLTPPPPPPPAPPPAPLPPLPLYPKSATRPMRSNEQIVTDEYQIDDRDDQGRSCVLQRYMMLLKRELDYHPVVDRLSSGTIFVMTPKQVSKQFPLTQNSLGEL